MDILSAIRNLFSKKDKTVRFSGFADPLGNFTIYYPVDWKFDRDVAVVDGKYTISFESRDGRAVFVISVDAKLPPDFNFQEYAKKELESPTAGIYTKMKKAGFRNFMAYEREYSFRSGDSDQFGGGLMFYTGKTVFSLSWNAPIKKRTHYQKIFNHMMETLVLQIGFSLSAPKEEKRGFAE